MILNNKIEICKKIRNNIQNLTSTEIDELFKIIHKNNINYTKNNNGIFINLNWIDDDIINTLNNYIDFCLLSQKEIIKYENMKTLLTSNIVSNTEKDNTNIVEYKQNNILNQSNITNQNNQKQKISSSMKFYLLKKKFFFKQNTNNSNYYLDSKLTHEEYNIKK